MVKNGDFDAFIGLKYFEIINNFPDISIDPD